MKLRIGNLRLKTQLEWAASIGRSVAERRGITGAYVDDVVSQCQDKLCELFQRFDVSLHTHGSLQDHFRGWCRQALFRECLDEIKRIRGGGLIRRKVRVPFACQLLSEAKAQLSYTDPEPVEPVPEPTPEPAIDAAKAAGLASENDCLHLRSQLRAIVAAETELEIHVIAGRTQDLHAAGRIDRASYQILRSVLEQLTLGLIQEAAAKRLIQLKRSRSA